MIMVKYMYIVYILCVFIHVRRKAVDHLMAVLVMNTQLPVQRSLSVLAMRRLLAMGELKVVAAT